MRRPTPVVDDRQSRCGGLRQREKHPRAQLVGLPADCGVRWLADGGAERLRAIEGQRTAVYHARAFRRPPARKSSSCSSLGRPRTLAGGARHSPPRASVIEDPAALDRLNRSGQQRDYVPEGDKVLVFSPRPTAMAPVRVLRARRRICDASAGSSNPQPADRRAPRHLIHQQWPRASSSIDEER